MPISYRKWKGKEDNPHVVPDSVKNLLWDEILKHFTYPQGVEPANVKRWTLTRMATQFQKFKQQLNKDYIKKNRTPSWIEYPKLKEHWTSFVEYKKSEDFAKASARGKKSRAKKEHDHHLGRGGYAFVVPKWRKMEDLLAQGTIPAVVDWPERVKNWYYAHGGTINSEDRTFDYPPSLRETALEILKILEDVRAGRVKVDREIDELAMALKNPEHPGRCRGFGVVPWKFGFRGDISTYRSRKRRRDRKEEDGGKS
jgi:hypothetical protein